jgi:branched-subunit amino acid ABC-type transport system permease component
MSDFYLVVGFGLVTTAILALSTVALSLQYGVTNIPNFAHGEIMTVGAYAAFTMQGRINNLFLEGLVAVVMGAAVAWLMNRTIIQPFLRAHAKPLILFVLTIAISIVVQNAILLFYGGSDEAYVLPYSAPNTVGPLLLTGRNEMIIVSAVVIMVALHLLLRYTKFGKAQRAVSDSPELARISGINSGRIIELTWLLAGAIAGFSGFVLAMSVGAFSPTLGFQFLLVVFAAAIVGGIGQPYGAMLGALLIGMSTEVSALYIASDYKNVVAFGLLIVMLLVRPGGIVSTKLRNVTE